MMEVFQGKEVLVECCDLFLGIGLETWLESTIGKGKEVSLASTIS
jgi:hypothetical protein